MNKIHKKKDTLELVARMWSNYDQWINTTCEHHKGRWSKEKQEELRDAMSKRDAYQDILNEVGYFN